MVRAANAAVAPRWRAEATAPWVEPGWGSPEEARRPTRRYKIRRRSRLRLRPEARLVATVGTLFLLAVLVISRYAVLYEMNRAILQRQQEVARLERATERLAIEVANLDSLDRLESAARARGYEEPGAVRAVRVPAGAAHLAEAGGAPRGPDRGAAAAASARPVRETVVALQPASTPAAPAGRTAADPTAAAANGSGATPGGGATGGAAQVAGAGTQGASPAGWIAGLWQRWFGS